MPFAPEMTRNICITSTICSTWHTVHAALCSVHCCVTYWEVRYVICGIRCLWLQGRIVMGIGGFYMYNRRYGLSRLVRGDVCVSGVYMMGHSISWRSVMVESPLGRLTWRCPDQLAVLNPTTSWYFNRWQSFLLCPLVTCLSKLGQVLFVARTGN